jgi:hypothetical protein
VQRLGLVRFAEVQKLCPNEWNGDASWWLRNCVSIVLEQRNAFWDVLENDHATFVHEGDNTIYHTDLFDTIEDEKFYSCSTNNNDNYYYYYYDHNDNDDSKQRVIHNDQFYYNDDPDNIIDQ